MRLAIGVGVSLGDRRGAVELAARRLGATPGLALVRASRLYRTPPMRGGTARGAFWNAVLLFRCELDPLDVLARCRALEADAGRRRARFWGDRPLDLDLLVAEGVTVATPDLVLPHPGVATRPFVRIPLIEVWPDVRDAVTGRPLAEVEPTFPRPAPVGVLARARAREASTG